jgi:octaprenyl-diphosphate synthase
MNRIPLRRNLSNQSISHPDSRLRGSRPTVSGGFIDLPPHASILNLVNPRPDLETPPDKTVALKKAFEPVRQALETVEARIRAQAAAFDPSVEAYVAHAIQSHGKRLRPALALLAGGATGAIQTEHVQLAVIVELIHAATLVHDDVLDEASTRRSQPTANAQWGNSLAVLLGDSLFAHALKLASEFEDSQMCRKLAEAAREVCSGEVIQSKRRFDLQLSVADYYRILEMKTGALFAVATELGARLNHSSESTAQNLRAFGLRLGTAYQIYDDCLDIAGDESGAGKTLGTDLRRGKLTLPILHLLETSTPTERQQLESWILQRQEGPLRSLVEQAVETGAIRFAVATGRRLLKEASESLESLEPSPHRESLSSLCVTLDAMIAPLGV